MKLRLLLFTFTFICLNNSYSTPTIHASNLNFARTGCTGLTLSWTKGNGTARMIIAKQGSAPAYAPVNSIYYNNFSAVFGSSVPYGTASDEYVVYKGNGDSVNIIGLSSNNTYYFTIYEFEIGTNGPEYYTSSAPTASATTHYVSLSFTRANIDSCEISNVYRYTNTSTSSIPGLKYRIVNNWADTTLNSNTIDIHVKASGFVTNKLTHNSSLTGCSNFLNDIVKVYPNYLADIDWKNGTDSVQDFLGHLFKYQTIPKTIPFPAGVTYTWNYGDGTTSYFNKMQKSYNDTGRFYVQLEMSLTENMKPVGCFDTINFSVRVTGFNPYLLIKISPLIQEEDSNKIYVSITNNNITYTCWRFGDGDSSLNANDTHIYDSAGTYNVRLDLTTISGKKGVFYETVYITKKQNTGLNKSESDLGTIAYPNPLKEILYLTGQSVQAGTTLQLYGLDGKLVLEKVLTDNENYLDVSQIKTGQYTLILTRPDKTVQVISVQK